MLEGKEKRNDIGIAALFVTAPTNRPKFQNAGSCLPGVSLRRFTAGTEEDPVERCQLLIRELDF